MRRLIPGMLLLILLTGCGLQAPANPAAPGSPSEAAAPTSTPILPPTLSGDVGVQELMLTSAARWQSLQITYAVTQYFVGAQTGAQVQYHQVWLRQPAEFKVIVSDAAGGPATLTLSDGKTILDSLGSRMEAPPALFEPFVPPTAPSDTVVLHPLAGMLGTLVSDLIFPVGLAQRGGDYHLVNKEILAGRTALVVEWSREAGLVIDRFWVDERTGVILRQQNFGKERRDSPQTDIQATYVAFEPDLAPGTFDLAQAPAPEPTPAAAPVGTATATVLPQVLNIRSGPGVDYKAIATVKGGTVLQLLGRRTGNDWWKVQFGDQEGWVSALYVEVAGETEALPVLNY